KSDETDLPMVRILPHTRNQNTSPSGTIRFTLITGRSRELVTGGEIDLALVCDKDAIGDCSSRLILMEDLWFYAAPDD
ncbi:hypothetical protein VQ042_24920, partial [Aurantimonas sp. A2-1-M11]|uniref:hypothetical protein n=1 Tax=Aurantimonas sp. A2-1-M11 TaxID=3113712 RepID=UPI002F95C626